MIFVSVFFQESIRLDSGGPLLLKSNILSLESLEVESLESQVLKNLLNSGKLYEIYIFLEFEKMFRTSIFLSTSEGLLLNIPETRSSVLWIFHFSLL